jgi:glycosyltransferase involved in cell wall biosynthesis
MPKPFASILIDTYNHERFIEEAILSVLAQDFSAADREILVVDDGSTDRTPEILNRFGPEIRVFRKPNGGQASAFNCGIPQCLGEIVAFLDGDDWWAPGKLTAVAQAFSANTEVGLVGHSITEVLIDGTRRSELVREAPRFRIDSPAGARIFRYRKSFLGTSRMAFRAKLLRRIGPVPEPLVIEADEFLFTLGALYSEVLLLREPLTFYRLHGQNLFQLSTRDTASLRRKHAVLLALVEELRRRFAAEHIAPEICRLILDAVQIDADLMRLSLGEGTPLDSFRTELQSYDLNHEQSSFVRRFLKSLTLVPALFLAPRRYNALKQKVAANSWYTKARKKFLPVHRPSHVDRFGNWNL